MSSSLLPVTAPPSPEGMCLEFWKLKQPRSPSVPHFWPLYSASQAWQASSTTASLCFLAMALIASISQGMPKMWTGRMARVRSVIRLSIVAGSIVSVAGSVSANTGRALALRIALYVAMNVYGETITSSPASTPMTCRAIISEVVPLAVARQRLAPSSFA